MINLCHYRTEVLFSHNACMDEGKIHGSHFLEENRLVHFLSSSESAMNISIIFLAP